MLYSAVKVPGLPLPLPFSLSIMLFLLHMAMMMMLMITKLFVASGRRRTAFVDGGLFCPCCLLIMLQYNLSDRGASICCSLDFVFEKSL